MSTSWRPSQDEDITSRPRSLLGWVDSDTDDSDAGTVESILFGSAWNSVKKSKRGACEQKAATVLPNRTAAT